MPVGDKARKKNKADSDRTSILNMMSRKISQIRCHLSRDMNGAS